MVLKTVMEGSSKASIARVQEISVSTVQRWIERGAKHASAFTDRLVRELKPVEIQADELRGCGPSRRDRHHVFATIEVNARLTSPVRSSRSLGTLIDLLQCYYKFARPYSSLKVGSKKRTLAMQAGLVTQTLSLSQIFMSTGPLAQVHWIVDPKVREGWRTACGSNSW